MVKKAVKNEEVKLVVSEESKVDFSVIEKKWQKEWEENKIFEVKEDPKKKKFYCLDMFPYPSGAGLHMGHAFTFSLGDIFARFKRMQGFNVLYPIGYDSLGLPAENAAIKVGTHPADYTKKSTENFMRQQKAMGWSYDWRRLVTTCDPSYYKWDQWIFLKMLEKGLAYRKKSAVNWCPKCETVLANEQVVNGKCWRHEDTNVEIKQLEQWFLRITDYSEELLEKLDTLNWPERAKVLQRNWIGKSQGAEIHFEINGEPWPIFTTRADTLYGVTFMVVSSQHSRLMDLVTKEQKLEVEKFLKKLKSVSEKEMENMDKEGVFTGSYAVNPLTKEKIPIWAGNFVLADYGSGMVMAVPTHDQRDFEFAKKYKIPMKVVIQPKDGKLDVKTMKEAFVGEGVLVNSDKFNRLENKMAINEIISYLESKKLGKKTVNYKLRDWLISRQRYWGTPIPVIYCDKCGVVPVPEKDLPVKLPEKVQFGKGNPILTNPEFVNVKCPKCNGKAKRETDTMDTFVNSSWYYLRYTDPKNDKAIFDSKKANYWAPVDQYIGGPEHICMHLIYIRFYTKFLRDIGLLKFDEPALRYFTQGIILGSDGDRMSKSKGNVVEPLDTIKKYGADCLRLYLVSNGSADSGFAWSDKTIQGSFKFVNNVFSCISGLKFQKPDERILSKLNKTIKEVTEDVENFRHNLAVIKLRELFSYIYDKPLDKESVEKFLKLLHIYCPFITEELWHNLGNKTFISLEKWPDADESKINEKFEQEEKNLEKTVSDILNVLSIIKQKTGKEGNKIYLYVMPFELAGFNAEAISKRVGKEVKVFAVNDKSKYDPEGKAGKAKPGKPGIYIE